MKVWSTNKLHFSRYTTFTPHSDTKTYFHTYVTSHVQMLSYEIIVTLLSTTLLRTNKTCIIQEALDNVNSSELCFDGLLIIF